MSVSMRAGILVATRFAAIMLFGACAQAEDIDIYTYPPPGASQADVLIVLDSSANWGASIAEDDCSFNDGTGGPNASNPNIEQGTKMAIEKCALYNVVDAIPEGLINVGLMLFNESPAAHSGGYPRHAIVELTATNKASLKDAIRNLAISDDKGNNAAFAKSLYESYLYLTKRAPYKGTAGTKWDSNAVNAGRYDLPTSLGCTKHVIFIANGSPGEVTDGEAKDMLAAAGGNTTQIVYPSSVVTNSDQANWADEFARFMRTQGIVTHTVAVTGAASDGRYPKFIENVAQQGGGSYTAASTSEEISDALLRVFLRIQAVSSVFSSASLPVSVNARGTYLNQVFMGMFLPDVKPRWVGNLKQFEFAYNPVTDSLKLVDSVGEDAINETGGFIQPGAISYWTSPSSFWVNQPGGVPESTSDSPDGHIVAKGGAAQMLRETYATDQSSRSMFTCLSCSTTTKVLGADAGTIFSNAIGAAAFGVGTDAERDDLVAWIKGTDNNGDEWGPGGSVTVRPSIHGDVVHSRPAVVNYGGSTGVVLFYGANDGMLHAVRGAKSGAAAGKHLWSFLPEEHFSRLNRLRTNTPLVSFPNLITTDPVAPRDWFVDGPISIYQKVATDGSIEKVYLYVGMRRGGRFLYAFDMTNPEQPKFLWKKTSADISVLGQTWSEARVIKIRGRNDPVILMGAGYDPAAEDVEPAGSVTSGNAVLVLDAFTGRVLQTFDGLQRPVAADVSVLDTDYDGYVDRAYAVDLGGNIYRIDFELTDRDTGETAVDSSVWELNTFATLGAGSARKFFYAPDVVLTRSYAIVLAGTGDREKPLEDASQDYFYTVLDRYMHKGMADDFTTIVRSQLVAQDAYATTPDAQGCYVQLQRGEKVVNAPMTTGGKTYFGTNRPMPTVPGTCAANLGEARTYSMPLVCDAPSYTLLEGGGLPPSPVAGVVQVTYTDPLTGEEVIKHVPFIIGGENDKHSPIEASRVTIPLAPKRTKVYWYTESER